MPARDNYTDPELHDQVKEEIQESDKGGAPGQWSARKAQFTAQEYKKRGGTYKTDKETGQDDSQKNLSKWSEEDWQTKDGSGEAKQSDGSRQRYLPKKAWEQMDDEEKEKTDAKKQEASKEGQQFVGNTEKAKEARQNANEEESEKMEARKTRQAKNGNSNGTKKNGKSGAEKTNGKNADAEDEDEEMDEEEEEEEVDDEAEDDDEDFKDDSEEEEDDDPENERAENEPEDNEQQTSKPARGQKRKQSPSSSSKSSNKKSKSKSNTGDGTIGSKHDKPDAPAPQGSAERLPKVGQKVSWKALPGWVHGEVIGIVTEDKEVEGKRIKGSESDPRLALRADSGKVAGHKPEACYFEDE